MPESKAPWKIPYFHHPPFNAGPGHGASYSVLRHWVDLFQRSGVKVVFTGHEHNFQFSDLSDATGHIHYIVSGAGGELRSGNVMPNMPRAHIEGWAAVRHFLVVEIDGQAMRITPIAAGRDGGARCRGPGNRDAADRRRAFVTFQIIRHHYRVWKLIARYAGGVKFEVAARGHRVVCDQPVENGGADEGMSPPEFLLASLATCGGYYAAQYLKARGLSTDGLQVRVTAQKAPQPARLGSFQIEVSVANRWTNAMKPVSFGPSRRA